MNVEILSDDELKKYYSATWDEWQSAEMAASQVQDEFITGGFSEMYLQNMRILHDTFAYEMNRRKLI